MATNRVIYSTIWDDDWFGPLPYMEQGLWIGLFSKCADDQGRMIDNARVICAAVYPYHLPPPEEIEAALARFAADERIVRYEVAGKRYIQLVHWWEHQHPQWAMPSRYPPPPGWNDRIRATIKGKYTEINWKPTPDSQPGKADEKPTPNDQAPVHLDIPPGPATLDDNVTRHDLDLDLDLEEPTSVGSNNAAHAAESAGQAARNNGQSESETALQRQLKALFTVKRLNETQRASITTLEQQYGYSMVVSIFEWARKKNMKFGDTIIAAETAAPNWTTGPPGKRKEGSGVPDGRDYATGWLSEFIHH